jgi:hypothetical protein
LRRWSPTLRLTGVRLTAGIALSVGAAIAATAALVVDPQGSSSANRRPQTLIVDRDSRGGGCSDERQAHEADRRGSPWCSFERAAQAAPSGSTVFVRGGRYPVFVADGDRSRPVTFRPYRQERVTLAGATLRSGQLRLEGFDITGTVGLAEGVSRVALVGNKWATDGRSGGSALYLKAGVRYVLVERNRIAQRASVQGVNAIDFDSTNALPAIGPVTIRGNRIGPVPGGDDAIQAKHTRSLRVEDNEFFGVRLPPGSDSHPDVLQSIYGARDLVLRGNFIHDISAQAIAIDDFMGENRNVRIRDNVIARVAYPWVAMSVDGLGGRLSHNTIDATLTLGPGTRGMEVIANIAAYGLLIDPAAEVSENFNLSRRFTRPSGRRSITGRPRYRNPTRDDFRLTRGSRGSRSAPGRRDLGALHGKR